MSEHADLEALSAYVDGEAPEWAAHVASCASCRASAEELRGVASAVGAPVEPADPSVREAAVGAALGDLHRRQVAERARSRPRRYQWQFAAAAAAAMLVVAVGFTALLSRTSDRTTVAGPAPEAATSRDQALSESSAAASVPPADLGDVPDAATLLARARPAPAGTGAGSGGAGGAGGAAAMSGNSGAASTPAVPPVGGQRSAAPTVAGTRPCEEQARAREPSLGPVVYFATARRGPVPAVVLGFSTGPAPAPVTLLMLAQDGCSELLRAAGP
ncbi:MAG TPA: zf-HC2 domain-containing protein [Acidimicrobiales bacterium]|nr:zf-HC2 domain-containing protein [Acidimicrobiales bacterium]